MRFLSREETKPDKAGKQRYHAGVDQRRMADRMNKAVSSQEYLGDTCQCNPNNKRDQPSWKIRPNNFNIRRSAATGYGEA